MGPRAHAKSKRPERHLGEQAARFLSAGGSYRGACMARHRSRAVSVGKISFIDRHPRLPGIFVRACAIGYGVVAQDRVVGQLNQVLELGHRNRLAGWAT